MNAFVMVTTPRPARFLNLGLVAIIVGSVTARCKAEERSLAMLEQQAFRAAVQKVGDSVVQLRVIGGVDRVDDVALAAGPTTGTIVSADGYVVTSLLRFSPPPTTVIAQLADGQQFSARIVATDHSRKLVLLKLQGATDLPTAVPAPLETTRVGQWAIAVGRTYRADRTNVSIGIVSAHDRLFGRAMQTDAAISAANYGGPLVDIEGRVMGIIAPMAPGSESAIAGADWYDSGIGFAVPLEPWLKSLERLKQGEDLHRGMLGVSFEPGVEREIPPKVKACIPGGPADKAEVKPGDVIRRVNGQPISTFIDLKFALGPLYAGDRVDFTILRDKEEFDLEGILASAEELGALEPPTEEREGDEPAEQP